MNVLEEKLLQHVNLDAASENALISLAQEINSMMSNFPGFDFGTLIECIAQLVNALDSATVENNDLMSSNVNLNYEISQLNTSFDNYKKNKREELNESVRTQDEIIIENKAMGEKLVLCQEKIQTLQTSLEKLKEGNKDLSHPLPNDDAMCYFGICPSDTNNTCISYSSDKDSSYQVLLCELNNALKANSDLSLEIKKLHNEADRLKRVNVDKWVDDLTIQAYFSSFNESNLAKSSKSLFVGPGTTELLKHGSSDVVSEQLNSLKISTFKFAFFCVNNNESLEWSSTNEPYNTGHGSHWSLLFVNIVNREAYHLDSLSNLNLKYALGLAEKLGIKGDNLHTVSCQKQNNNFECGLNVLLNAKAILNCFCSKSGSNNICFVDWSRQFFEIDSKIILLSDVPTSQPVNNLTNSPSSVNSKSLERDCWEMVKRRKAKPAQYVPPSSLRDVVVSNRFSPLSSLSYSGNSHTKHSVQFQPTTSFNKTTRDGPYAPSPKSKRSFMSSYTCKGLKPGIKVFSDSHGRALSSLLNDKLQNLYSVVGFVKPGAKMEQVLEGVDDGARSCKKDDFIIIMGGTNNLNVNGRCSDFLPGLDDALSGLSKLRVLCCGLPYRYDLPHLNQTIAQVNLNIQTLTSKYENITYVPLDSLPRSNYTGYGLHFNWKGKKRIANILGNYIDCTNLTGGVANSVSKPSPEIPSGASFVKSHTYSKASVKSHNKKIRPSFNSSKNCTFTNSHFLGEARRPVGVPWAHYMRGILGAGTATV